MSLDRLEAVLRRFHVGVELFHTGPLCGSESFDARPGRGFLHLLRNGAMEVRHAVPGHPRVQRVDEPMLLFYPAGDAHRFRAIDDAAAPVLTCAALNFDGGQQHPLVAGLPALVALPLREVGGLEASLALLFDEADHVRCGHRVLADRLLEVVLIQLLRWLFDHPDLAGATPGLIHALSDPRLARALVAIHARPGHAWTLDALAAEAGMSRASFTAAFRRQVGRSAGDYLADYRMLAARRELSLGRPVARVADELGYASPAAFARMFKARAGQTPKQWALRA
ncbi:AraC family transcriptional regulator [Luteimonas arsenica]|uniref:AraC family transcriptional regulator n=1 Tax=Luteimonas arsenica TaxID=1586242 RepID=UPI0010542948|nr:AraC family transcriptional regulator [Luteimonas arsenica]